MQYTIEAIRGMDPQNPRQIDLGVMDEDGTVVERFTASSYGKSFMWVRRMYRSYAFDLAAGFQAVESAFSA
jgi:hypothetical protein